jgi:hypothetical protein
MSKIYSKNTWPNEILSDDVRYDISEDDGTPIYIDAQIALAASISVITPGGAVNATRMENIENGIDTLDDALVMYTTGGTSTAFTLTTPQASSLATSERWRVKFNATAGVTPTLNRDSKGAKSLKYYDNTGAKIACSASSIVSGMICEVVYDGVDYVVINPIVNTQVSSGNELITTGGTSTAFTVTTTEALALATGEQFRVKFNATCGDSPTLNRDGKGAKSLKYYNNIGVKESCAPRHILINMICTITYDGTDYVVLNPAGLEVDYRRNVLPNGGMRIAQRGAGPFTSASAFVNNDDSYLLDGCIFLANGSDTCDVSQVADTDFVSGYKIRLDVETANRRFGILLPVSNADMQEIRKSGKASVQFKVKCTGTSMSNVRAYLLSWSSTADTITSDVISAWGSAGGDPTLVSNWTAENAGANLAITTTISQKSIENIAVDTASVANIALLIIVDDTDAQVGDFLEIGDVKIEEGSFCTDYRNDSLADEMARCMRRFELIQGATGANIFPGFVESTSSAIAIWSYKVKKAPVPAPTIINGTVGEFTVRYTGVSNSTVTAITLGTITVDTATMAFTPTGTPLTGGQACQIRCGSANAWIAATSEL